MTRQREPIRLQEGEHYTIGRMAWLMAEAEYPKAISASNQRVVFIATIQAKNGSMRTREPDDMRAISELWQRCGLPELFPAGEYPRFAPTGFDLAPYNDALNSEHWKHDWRPLLCDSTTNRSRRAIKAMHQYPESLRDEAETGAFTAFTDEGERARPGTRSQELFVSAKEAARYLQDVRGYTVMLEAAGQRQDTETLARKGTNKVWTDERKAEAQAYRNKHGLSVAAKYYGVSTTTISKHTVPPGQQKKTPRKTSSPFTRWGKR